MFDLEVGWIHFHKTTPPNSKEDVWLWGLFCHIKKIVIIV
jgi:hypothetical protein